MNSKNSFFTATFLFVASTITAQSSNLVGTWHLDINKAIEIMDPTYKTQYDTRSSDMKDRAVKAMTGREFVFSVDGNITVNWPSRSGPRVSTGSWVIDNPPGDLLITIGERTTGFRYEFPSETTLILRAKQNKGFFNSLYLEKIN